MATIKITNNIEKMIKKNKEEKGVGIGFIAKKAGISQQSLTNLYKSKNPMIESVIKVAYALNCSINELINIEVIDDNKIKKDINMFKSMKEKE